MMTILGTVAICVACFIVMLLSALLLVLNYRLNKIEQKITQSEEWLTEYITITMFNAIDALSNNGKGANH